MLIFCSGLYAKNVDSLQFMLNYLVANKDRYISIKEQNIEKLKQIFKIENFSPSQQYDINKKLFKEYHKFCSDSAITYILKNRDIAFLLNDLEMINETAVDLAGLYSTTGLYIEAFNLLQNIDRNTLSASLLPLYYETYADFFSHYGQSNAKDNNYYLSGLYRDSLLLTLDTRSFKYRLELATKQTFTAFNTEPEKSLLLLLEEADSTPAKGLIAWLLGLMYQQIGNTELCKKYFTISVISDIEHCIRDNASLQSLALIYFEEGDVASAYRFIQYSMDDALFCNVRYRISEASNYYPIIHETYQKNEKKQMKRLVALLILISILMVVVIISLIRFYRQNYKLMMVKNDLSQVNQQLNEINLRLKATNNSLLESNIIKEEYITHFFDVCSAYVNKLESYHKILNKPAKQDRVNEMLKILDYEVIKQELEELYTKFDTIFLNLYPTFVEDFNSVRTDESKIILKHGEMLNTELRIFALIRLGINNSEKIASFLRYSLSAIYNYRVKARKYCNTDKKTFEELVMRMGKGEMRVEI